jgi:hypothetical protein
VTDAGPQTISDSRRWLALVVLGDARLIDRDHGIGVGRGADVLGAGLVTGALMLGVYTSQTSSTLM